MVWPMVKDSSGVVISTRHSIFRLNVEVVGDHHVVDHGLQHLVDFAFRREQADLLQAVNHVDFSLTFPGALGFDGVASCAF